MNELQEYFDAKTRHIKAVAETNERRNTRTKAFAALCQATGFTVGKRARLTGKVANYRNPLIVWTSQDDEGSLIGTVYYNDQPTKTKLVLTESSFSLYTPL